MSAGSSHQRSVTLRRRLLLGGWVLAGLVILARAAEVQVLESSAWKERAERQHQKTLAVPAPRGEILDRNGVPLALSQERLQVAVAPREVDDPAGVVEALVRTLDLPSRTAVGAVSSEGRWVVLPGRYPPAVRDGLAGFRGIHLQREMERFHPHGELARGVLGRVVDGVGAGGIEDAFESNLRGRPGREIQARDSEGNPIPGESYLLEPPVPGGEVVLTLDLDLQEIAQEALESAVERTGARGGNLLVTDPRTGEILAMVSRRDGRAGGLSSINTPYEPGSTLKPFTVAAVLDQGLAALSDSVDTGDGRWREAGRTISDIRPYGRLTVADALRVSSNVGISKVARALDPALHYEALRDFGFGALTGIEIPGESPGTLRRPEDWSRQSPASLAIGYELAVTPVQMAMAYGALANGGRLMEPRLVREARSPDGEVIRRGEPRQVRRVVSEEVVREIKEVLVGVVEDGTGTAARLTSFSVAGKSGTSRAYGPLGGYEEGSYFSSFVGFFPAEEPQLVVFVKLERPTGAYYGGATAAPVTRTTLEAILAARQTPLDRRALLRMARRPSPPTTPTPEPRFALFEAAPPGSPIPVSSASGPPRAQEDGGILIPDLSGLPVRTAARRLHALGFRSEWGGGGAVAETVPSAGTRLAPGDTVRVVSRRSVDE